MSGAWHGGEVAIVGMAGRFPGAADVDGLWRAVRAGREAIRRLGPAELRRAGESDSRLARPDYVPASAVLDGVDRFDAGFFRLGPRDAALMDPQHRHLLEVAWTALEHAGYDPARVPGPVGVFAGCGASAYLPLNVLTNPGLMEQLGLFYVRHAGNDKDFLATRVSYALDLKGPSVSVQTAGSTSLVAVHLACQSLVAHECDLALAGGVTIDLPHGRGYLAGGDGRLSPDGHCRPFDDEANGAVFGSGAGVVVLRRLEDARRDGDTVYAVILGSAVGHRGLAAGNGTACDGNPALIEEALARAGVEAPAISFVEAHGGGTRAGDAVELRALAAAFVTAGATESSPALGSIKGHVGHLDAAAGVTSLITTTQALRHAEIPPTLHFHTLNRLAAPEGSQFQVDTAVRKWAAWPGPRTALVSALGDGGTDAHVVVAEAPEAPAPSPSRRWQLLTWSGHTDAAAERMTAALGTHLGAGAADGLADVAFTLAEGRRELAERRATVVESPADAARVLRERQPARVSSGRSQAPPPGVVFAFPGGGAQYPGMARDLYEREPLFRAAFGQCLAELTAIGVSGVSDAVFPAPGALEHAAELLKDRATLALPAIFSVAYALAQMLQHWGIRPSALIGHSLGEYVAACLSGVWSLPDALRIVATRGRLFDSLPPGAMMSVAAPAADLGPFLDDRISLAAVNSPTNTVLSGPDDAIAALEDRLTSAGWDHRRLPIRVAAHSRELEPILDEFRQAVRAVTPRPPQLPYVSNVTGAWVRAEEATDPEYWVRHLRSTVRFADGVATVLAEPRAIVELGPGSQLASLIRQHPARSAAPVILSSLRHAKETDDDQRTLLDAVGRLWCVGVPVDRARLFADERRRRVPLPTYPFARDRHWIEPGRGLVSADTPESTVVRPRDIDQWLGSGRWVPRELAASVVGEPAVWLAFTGRDPLAGAVVDGLRAVGRRVIVVRAGADFAAIATDEFTVRPEEPDDYRALLEAVGQHPSLGVVHTWALDAPTGDSALERFDATQALGFLAGFRLLQALQDAGAIERVRLWFLAAGFESADEAPVTRPDAATLRGLALVAPAEFPGLTVGTIDVGGGAAAAPLVAALVGEPAGGRATVRLAVRGADLFEHDVEMAPPDPASSPATLRAGGVYFITGGLGGVGLVYARFLAREHGARLSLVSRRGATAKHAADVVRELEALGGQAMVVQADVADAAGIRHAVVATRERFGHIDGVFHAAGVLEPALIPLLSPEAAAEAMAAKTRGTIALEAALADDPPELLLLFSSISALVGIAGQAAYAGASAFLDAFAATPAPAGQRRLAIDFGPWRDAGMTARASLSEPADESARGQQVHPLVGRRVAGAGGAREFAVIYRPADMWVLAEHAVREGPAVLPGAAVFQTVAAALAATPGGASCTLEDLAFIEPLTVARDGEMAVRVSLRPSAEGLRYTLESWPPGADHRDHQSALVRDPSAEPPAVDVGALRTRCTHDRGLDSSDPFRHQALTIEFGPRWQSPIDVRYGVDEALTEISAGAATAGDEAYPWHPALLDLAMTSGLALAAARGDSPLIWVPAGCDRVALWSPPGARLLAHARLRRGASPDRVAVFDVTLLDPGGKVHAELTGLRMRGVEPARLSVATTAALTREAGSDPVLALARQHGILEAEGTAALPRALAYPSRTVILSSLDVEGLAAHLSARSPAAPAGEGRARRPDSVRSRYEAPRSDLERRIADVWARQLGLDRVGVGVEDNFFELGGESLVGLRLFAEIRRTFGVALPIDALFSAPTVAALAGVLQARMPGDASPGPAPAAAVSSAVVIQPGGDRPRLFCVHDQNGYVLLYRDLARHLGADQPFIALQASGLDDPREVDRSITAMASRYVSAVRQLQPAGPYWLAGSSLGGIVAFEMAQQLTSAGEDVPLLALFDSWTPADLRRWWFLEVESVWSKARRHLRELITMGPQQYVDLRRENRRSWQRYLEQAEAERQRHAELQAQVDTHLAEGTPMPPEVLTFHLEQRYGEAYRAYEAQAYPGRLTLFRARERGHQHDVNPTLGWGDVRLGGLEVIEVPGLHGLMVREPHVEVLARELRAAMDRVMAARGRKRQSASSRKAATRRA